MTENQAPKMSKPKKKPKKSIWNNLDTLIMLSHLGLFLVLACWFLCYTEFYQACSDTMRSLMNIITLGTLINISMLLLVKNGMKLRSTLQICEFVLALLYATATFFVYQQLVS